MGDFYKEGTQGMIQAPGVETTGKSSPVPFPHSVSGETVLVALESSFHGVSEEEAKRRLQIYGRNSVPRPKPPSLIGIFIHQFASPLIYVLLAAVLLSVAIQEWSDAIFISIVLLLNAAIGTFQEYSAQRAAEALHRLITAKCRVVRNSEIYELDAEKLVPGDIVVLESGDKIPADLRLLSEHDLDVDESLLTGESLAVKKDAGEAMAIDIPQADMVNMLFSGTLVCRGRARAVVVSTGLETALGRIAADVLFKPSPKAPLQVRMDVFTKRVAIFVGLAALIMFTVAVTRGTPLAYMFMLTVALAVSVIPEGLPVALTVALAVGLQRMARRNVIVTRLIAVEALGSCTFIATDKTGTLTVNQLTVNSIVPADGDVWSVTGEGIEPTGKITSSRGELTTVERNHLQQMCHVAVLANEGFLGRTETGWSAQGDAVDVALQVMAQKAGISRERTLALYPELDTIPYESERLFSASLNTVDGQSYAFVKGAAEKLIQMCSRVAEVHRQNTIDISVINAQIQAQASQGYRVLALASGPIEITEKEKFSESHLHDLTFIGLVGIVDPLRPEAKQAVADCRKAGIEVAMVTGDHPDTAFAIGYKLGMVDKMEQVVTGRELAEADETGMTDSITRNARVFARVGPHQKLHIVESLQRNGHFVAVSGDGANDAPALRVAQVGVAMGKSGTDVARETSDMIITDDNFASIVAGVEEGRIAYANVRKVIFLLISTGAAELVLFTLALITGLPLPLLAVQLLWLNLVTNGIQDVALAFEPGEGDELKRAPRSPREPIFNRLMVERVIISALVIGTVAFVVFQWLLARGFTVEGARNGTLLLMVLFENVHVFNCRSETRSAFRHNPLSNPILLIGTVIAQLIHIAAMYTPWIKDVLGIKPVSLEHWFELLLIAFSVLLIMELHKFVYKYFGYNRKN